LLKTDAALTVVESCGPCVWTKRRGKNCGRGEGREGGREGGPGGEREGGREEEDGLEGGSAQCIVLARKKEVVLASRKEGGRMGGRKDGREGGRKGSWDRKKKRAVLSRNLEWGVNHTKHIRLYPSPLLTPAYFLPLAGSLLPDSSFLPRRNRRRGKMRETWSSLPLPPPPPRPLSLPPPLPPSLLPPSPRPRGTVAVKSFL
jgi:hypothetical protein